MKKPEETIIECSIADLIADFAQEALLEELYLTPKPGLVDLENNGSHYDLTLSLMQFSAFALRPAFLEMANAAFGKVPSQQLREQLAAIGRYGEQQMLSATGGINTHRGAIWCVGLLTAAATILISGGTTFNISDILNTAGLIASFDDRYQPAVLTNGRKASGKYNIISAREEAILGFPSLLKIGLPAWNTYSNVSEDIRRMNVLLALISVVDDTCILNRSDMIVLKTVQQKAKEIMACGGVGRNQNLILFQSFANYINNQWISPGGSADLLAASIFLHKVAHHFIINQHGNIFISDPC